MAGNKYLKNVSDIPTEEAAVQTLVGVGDAGKRSFIEIAVKPHVLTLGI